MPTEMTRQQVADAIEHFLDGTGGKWDWDDLCSSQIRASEGNLRMELDAALVMNLASAKGGLPTEAHAALER